MLELLCIKAEVEAGTKKQTALNLNELFLRNAIYFVFTVRYEGKNEREKFW